MPWVVHWGWVQSVVVLVLLVLMLILFLLPGPWALAPGGRVFPFFVLCAGAHTGGTNLYMNTVGSRGREEQRMVCYRYDWKIRPSLLNL